MSDRRTEALPGHVRVYGNDHSPWVQTVLLGLNELKIEHTLVTVPPLSVFARSGILMPAARIDDGPWLLDSERILVELGFSEVDAESRRKLLALFLSGARQRTRDPWAFWSRFAQARDEHPSTARRLWNHFWRTFSVFYFFSLISVLRRSQPEPTPEQLVEEFAYWEERLAPGVEFLGGRAPDTVDLQLFGLVQMFASIPGASLATLEQTPGLQRLRNWISRMQSRFADYDHLYSAPCFEPRLPEIDRANPLERTFYWSGAALMWLGLPITLATTFYFVRRVRKKGLQRG